VSRLDFAPKLETIEIIDIKQGLGRFTPKPDKAASFAALRGALKKAGYQLDSAEISVVGSLVQDGEGWWLEVPESRQRFALGGELSKQLAAESATGASFKVIGDWQSGERGKVKREVIELRSLQRLAFNRHQPGDRFNSLRAVNRGLEAAPAYLPQPAARLKIASPGPAFISPTEVASAITGRSHRLVSSGPEALAEAVGSGGGVSPAPASPQANAFFAPIRTTSPGLTVYRGGAFMPRYEFTRQHLGDLEVRRQSVNFSLSYTPTSTLQLEAQIPYAHTSFKAGSQSGSGQGFGNLLVSGKYRFFRCLETWGDKQAALRFAVELPTAKKAAPADAGLGVPDFVRQQLRPSANGWAAHLDTSYSQARRRWIYGANLEATLRAERDGFRMGQEIRLNTDLEYVLLPLKYRSPTKELFLIFETTYLHRGAGRLSGARVAGSRSDEFYLAPGLQYVASERFIVEASYQLPLLHRGGALVLRNDSSFLFGFRYLY
jgi:hypothetical protein